MKTSTDLKVQALAEFLSVEIDTIETVPFDSCAFDTDGEGEYLVYTDAEADDAWDESLDQYIDDCIIPELPEFAARYFDVEAWKRDARYDGRGHSLSGYDGEENEIQVDGTWFYIYRTN